MQLTGKFIVEEHDIDVGSVLQQIDEAYREEMERRERMQAE